MTTINLDKKRELRYTREGLMKLVAALGVAPTDLKSYFDGPQLSSEDKVAWVLWTGLIHEDPDLTMEKVRELLVDFHRRTGGDLEKRRELAAAINEGFGTFGKRRRPRLFGRHRERR